MVGIVNTNKNAVFASEADSQISLAPNHNNMIPNNWLRVRSLSWFR